MGLARAEEGGVVERVSLREGRRCLHRAGKCSLAPLAAPREVCLHALGVQGSHPKLPNGPLVLSSSVASRSAPGSLVPRPPA